MSFSCPISLRCIALKNTSHLLLHVTIDRFEQKWDGKYAYTIKSWRANWTELVTSLDFPPEIRHIIYTTNIIESLNSGVQKFNKNKTIFPYYDIALKVVYMAVANVEKSGPCVIKIGSLSSNNF